MTATQDASRRFAETMLRTLGARAVANAEAWREGHPPRENAGRRWKVWPRREAIGDPGCVIMYRWELVNFGPGVGKLLLHHFLPDRDDRDPHDHPSSFVTVVLRGGYQDMVPCGRCRGRGLEPSKWMYTSVCWGCNGSGVEVGDRLRAGSVRYRKAEHMHITKMGPDGAWTLCWMGPKRRAWGFRVLRGAAAGAWVPWKDYVKVFGFGERC